MQKNKPSQKGIKPSKPVSNHSSRALLQLSQITANSKQKSNLTNFTDRSCYLTYQKENSLQQTSAVNAKQKAKSYSLKQNNLKKNNSNPKNVLNEILLMSNSFPVKNTAFQSSKNHQKTNDLIIFSKNDLQKNKNFYPTSRNKKLLLYENKENYQYKESKSNQTCNQTIKAQPILCSIKILPIEEQTLHQSFLSSQKKRESFDGKRSSLNSRRSSINLSSQDDLNLDFKNKQKKNSNPSKRQLLKENIKNSVKDSNQSANFTKKLQSNCDDNLFLSSFQSNPAQSKLQKDELTHLQDKETKERYLEKLDELTIVEQDIKKQCVQFISIWEKKIFSEKNLKNYQNSFNDVKRDYEKLHNQFSALQNLLFQQNKCYAIGKRMLNNNCNSQKQNILLEVQKIHINVKKRVFKKDLEETMIFNMKVVLPSSQMTESSISCFENHISATLNYSNISVLQLYQELMNQKACKKYGMILKKQINNMNIYDNRAMNQYLKKLYDLQIIFNRIQNQTPQTDLQYLDRIEDLIEKIQNATSDLSDTKKKYDQLEANIQSNQTIKSQSQKLLQQILNQISQSVYTEYKMFQTGKNQVLNPKNSIDSVLLNQDLEQKDKRVEEFRQLVTKKYESLYHEYSQVLGQKQMILDSLKGCEQFGI